MSLILQVEQQVTSSMSFINLDDEVFQSDETTVEVEHVSPLRCEEVLLEKNKKKTTVLLSNYKMLQKLLLIFAYEDLEMHSIAT